MMLTSGLLTMFSVAYSVVDLPDPVGPVTRIIPYGLVNDCCQRSKFHSGEAQVRQVEHGGRVVQDSHDDLLAPHRGQGRDAQVDLLAAVL